MVRHYVMGCAGLNRQVVVAEVESEIRATILIAALTDQMPGVRLRRVAIGAGNLSPRELYELRGDLLAAWPVGAPS